MVIDSNGDADVTNMPGSLEECIGNCTVEKRSKGKFTSTHELLDAYRNKDEIATQVWLASVKKLAIGIRHRPVILFRRYNCSRRWYCRSK
jgi:glucokinase